MISVEEAITRVVAAARPLPIVQLPLAAAQNHFVAAELSCPIDLPLFDNSAMDGYAVRAEDLKCASIENPVTLRLKGRIRAGDEAAEQVAPGECVRLFTGSQIPLKADAVVMQEDVSVTEDTVIFSEPVKPLENIRLTGEDIRKGTLLLKAGAKLIPARIGLIAATGIPSVPVHRACMIGLLATGNELREPGEPIAPGEIYESNRTMLSAALRTLGAEVAIHPIVRDTLEDTIGALRSAFETADVVITTGGVSVGELDFVKEAFTRLGGEIDLWRVAMRPGKPFVFGRFGDKLLFGLPGNPISAFVTFQLFVRPAVLKFQGAADLHVPRFRGELTEPIANRGDRRHFARVFYEYGKVRIAGPQKSHMIASLAQANGLLDIAPGTEFRAGDSVDVMVWELPFG